MSKKKILDWNEYLAAAIDVVAEGCVLLKNDNEALPLKKNSRISVFGRIQNHYYKSGTGSGGMVNVTKVTSIVDGLRESKHVVINEDLADIYAEWEKENPFEAGMGWGNEPWSQREMPLSDEVAKQASDASDVAVVIIGRTAGEDQDVKYESGSFLLSDLEVEMMKVVRKHFDKMVVLLNVGGIIDMHFVDDVSPDAIMYVWQGGMTGGSGTADVLTGKVSPSGKLVDTIAYELEDYPSHKNFGDENRNFYQEDVYVGYRYFETFAMDKVRYPFGFGLSYTTFEIGVESFDVSKNDKVVSVKVGVKNTGTTDGKEVVQLYVNPPQGALGKPIRNLVDFKKTVVLSPGEKETLTFEISFDKMASYDDSGVTGNKSCWVLEAGDYEILVGNHVRNLDIAGIVSIDETIVVEKLQEALAPVLDFEVMKPVVAAEEKGGYKVSMVPVTVATVDMDERRKNELPEEIKVTGDLGIKLSDVLDGKSTMEEFVAQLSDDELCSLVRGEGMGSARVTPGTASAFAGVSNALVAKKVPAVCCDDGPSGMRLDCGTKAFSLPNGTLIASTFNPTLITKLYSFTGLEMVANKVECLLGPGMNIHRHPLNGRNFEYFSEDPYLTGKMGCAMLHGLHSANVTGTIKHFCANNQEKRRHFTDSVVSERALREIYLKGFEMAVKEGKATTIMTTYGSLNGLWTAGSYDLTTTILRKQWGFKGVAMTDWWAKINERGKEPNNTNFAAMVKAQNDLYMCCPNGETNESGDNTLESLQNGVLTRGELQRTAINVCRVAMESAAMKRLVGTNDQVEIINKPDDPSDIDISSLEFNELKDEQVVSLLDKPSVKDTDYVFPFEVKKIGVYKIALKGKSTLGELAQVQCTLFFNGNPVHVYTFHGDNKEAVLECEVGLYTKFSVLKLAVTSSGLELSDITFTYEHELVQL